jgi:hypothetical protein
MYLVCMAIDVMNLMCANPLLGALEAVGPENQALKWQRAKRVSFGPKWLDIVRLRGLTRFRTYNITLPSQTKTRRGGSLGQINNCRQIP